MIRSQDLLDAYDRTQQAAHQLFEQANRTHTPIRRIGMISNTRRTGDNAAPIPGGMAHFVLQPPPATAHQHLCRQRDEAARNALLDQTFAPFLTLLHQALPVTTGPKGGLFLTWIAPSEDEDHPRVLRPILAINHTWIRSATTHHNHHRSNRCSHSALLRVVELAGDLDPATQAFPRADGSLITAVNFGQAETLEQIVALENRV